MKGSPTCVELILGGSVWNCMPNMASEKSAKNKNKNIPSSFRTMSSTNMQLFAMASNNY